MSKVLILGCGYLGLEFGKQYRAQGGTPCTVTRSQSKAAALTQKGIQAQTLDLNKQFPKLDQKPDATLFCSGFEGENRVSSYLKRVRRACESLSRSDYFVYISSTGVYAENNGGLVSEKSALGPDRETAKACLDAEYLVRSAFDSYLILRLAGIYGPGRIPRKSADSDTPSPPSFLNLIHVEDAAQVIRLGIKNRLSGTFNLSDNHPVPLAQYDARLRRRPAPANVEVNQGKKIDSSKLFAALNPTLKYPNYESGLSSLNE